MSDPLFESQAATALKLRQSTTAQRRARLEKLLGAILDRKDAIMEAAQHDLGRHPTETHLVELLPLVGEVKHALRNLARWMKPWRIRPTLATLGTTSRVIYQPKGRCLVISPWNYPLSLALGPLVSAVAAGNTVMLKPSEFTPHTNRIVKQIVAMAFPPDEVAVVTGAADTATALLALPFDHIFFTGSPAVGKQVMAAAASHLASVTLELGGKSPVVVDASADLRDAAEHVIWGKLVNAGQTCVAPDYVLVDRRVEGPLTARLRDVVRDFFGDDPSESPDFGRIVNDKHFGRLTRLADGDGAGEVIYGNERDEASRYYAPTALRGSEPSAAIMQEEIFGPILPLIAVDDVDAAIEFVNAREKPLAMYIFSEDSHVTDHVLASTTAGGVCVNATLFHLAVPALPFGGVGESGMGAYHGRSSFETFTHEKSVLTKQTKIDPSLMYPPYRGIKAKLLRRFL
jgi:aldehyde dehydrogenase (NAD+)